MLNGKKINEIFILGIDLSWGLERFFKKEDQPVEGSNKFMANLAIALGLKFDTFKVFFKEFKGDLIVKKIEAKLAVFRKDEKLEMTETFEYFTLEEAKKMIKAISDERSKSSLSIF